MEQTANLNKLERAAAAVAGSLMVYFVARKHKKEALLLLGGGCLLYHAVSGRRAKNRSGRGDYPRNVNVKTSVVVARSRKEIYRLWRNLENLPLFMRHLESVDVIDSERSAWKVKIPGGFGELRWEARVVRDEPGVELSWQSVPGASIQNAGKINFSDTPSRGTRIDAVISYKAPLGAIGERVSRMLTPVFSQMIEKDIEGFKRFAENMGVGGD